MTKLISICFLIGVLSSSAFAQHRIDRDREACHEEKENQTTLGMIGCETAALQAWDEELNDIYKDLMRILEKPDQDRLRNAQRKWIAYRDAELEFANTLYNEMDGTMWLVVGAARRTEITRTRTLELKEYLLNK